jgi:hypothetical protein
MCNIDRTLEIKLLELGLNVMMKAVSNLDGIQSHPPSSDVLASATAAYQEGKITSQQLLEIIDCLNAQKYEQNAYTVRLNDLLVPRYYEN